MKTIVACVAGAFLIGIAGTALAQGAILLSFDTSARSAGMGGATTAVNWTDDPNVWANPALLGYHRGLRYQQLRAQGAVGISSADDIFLDSDRVTLGAYGVGFLYAGKPFGRMGGDYLDLGRDLLTDEYGDAVGTFHSYMKADSWGVGVSLAQVFDAIAGLDALTPSGVAGQGGQGLARYGDVAFGWTHKRYEDALVFEPLQGATSADNGAATMSDWGLLLSATPYNSIDNAGQVPTLDAVLSPLGGLRLDLSYGWSDLNYNNAEIEYVEANQSPLAPRVHRSGFALRCALGVPQAVRGSLENAGLGLVAESLSPLVSYSMSWDRSTPWYRWEQNGYVPGAVPEAREDLRGSELVLANIFYLRRGHVKAAYGYTDRATSGWGLGFRLADIAGFRYDRAEVPQAQGLPKVKSTGYTVFVDGVAIWQRLHQPE
jgi:hypothetical protein